MNTLAEDGYVHSLAPDLVGELVAMRDVASASSQSPEVELCRVRMRQMHTEEAREATPTGVDPAKAAAVATWWESALFTAHERACLNFTEQFVLSVGAVTQDDVDALRPGWSEEQIYDFVMALYVEDMSSRAALVLGSVFDDRATTNDSGKA